MPNNLDTALQSIPAGLRLPLVAQFDELLADYRAGRWEAVGLKAGKICEIVYSIIAGHIDGNFAAAPSKPKNMVTACQALEQTSASGVSRSVRIQIPRLLIAIYELRNNRAIGHVGGEVDPNHMDAEIFVRASKWLVAELIRVFDIVDVNAARNLVESVTERTIPVVWEGDGVKRILNTRLPTKDKILVLAYSSPNGVSSKNLSEWSGYSNISRLRNVVLKQLDKDALIHYDRRKDMVSILPTGIQRVEGAGLLTMG